LWKTLQNSLPQSSGAVSCPVRMSSRNVPKL